MPIVNSIISWFLKKRIHQIQLFLKYPIDVQDELLMKLINSSKRTLMGREYDFSSIKSYREFSDRIPIQKYESFSPFIERTLRSVSSLKEETLGRIPSGDQRGSTRRHDDGGQCRGRGGGGG